MRVVLDTNILVSALMSRDNACRRILRMAFEGNLEPLVGNALFCEYEAVLKRDELFDGRCPFDEDRRMAFLDDVASVCRWVEIRYLWRPNLRDEGDNHLMELAVAGQARAIVTQNIRDFRRTELLMPEIDILHPLQVLEGGEKKQWRH